MTYSVLQIKISGTEENPTILYAWIKINQVKGYLKLHNFLQKKKPDLKSMFVLFIGFILNIPLKPIIVTAELNSIKEDNLKNKVNSMYYNNLNRCKGLKIETLNKEIYINCFIQKDLIKIVKDIMPSASWKDVQNTIRVLGGIAQEGRNYEDKFNQKVIVHFARIMTKEGSLVLPKPQPTSHIAHPTTIYKIWEKMHFPKTEEEFKNFTGHQISLSFTHNVNCKIDPSQIKAAPLKEFIHKPSAKAPGSILTDWGQFEFTSPFRRNAPTQLRIESLLYTEKEQIAQKMNIKLELEHEEYFTEKDEMYTEVLKNIVGQQDASSQSFNKGLERFKKELLTDNWYESITSLCLIDDTTFEELFNDTE